MSLEVSSGTYVGNGGLRREKEKERKRDGGKRERERTSKERDLDRKNAASQRGVSGYVCLEKEK